MSSTAGSYEAERREDLSLRDTKLCNILIKKTGIYEQSNDTCRKQMIGSLEIEFSAG